MLQWAAWHTRVAYLRIIQYLTKIKLLFELDDVILQIYNVNVYATTI